MTKVIKVMAVGSLLAASALYGASTAACVGCHGKNFEKKAMGKSKVVKDMSKADIVAALKGYKAGTYGGAMKGLMKGQVAKLSDADMEAIAASIKGNAAEAKVNAVEKSEAVKAEAKAGQFEAQSTADTKKIVNINAGVDDPKKIAAEDLAKKKVISEEALGLRKTNLYAEESETAGVKADYSRPAPGTATRFERAFVNAPPMIPHSVDGLLPITQDNNQCLGCHMPEVAKGVGATPIPASHFTNYRPATEYKNGEVVKEGKKVGIKGDIGNTSDIKIAKAKKLNHLYQGRFNCSQCHAPQAKIDPIVGNTFQPDFGEGNELKAHSSLADAMNEGVQ
jgi:cytochrome c-type protein NapB